MQHAGEKTIAEEIEEVNQGGENLFKKLLTFTARETIKTDCIICARKKQTVRVIPIPGNLSTCEIHLCGTTHSCTLQTCVPLCLNRYFDPTSGDILGWWITRRPESPHDPGKAQEKRHLYDATCKSVAEILICPVVPKAPRNVAIAPGLCFPYCYKGHGNQVLGNVTNCEEIWSADQQVLIKGIYKTGDRAKVSWRISDLVSQGTLPIADIFWYFIKTTTCSIPNGPTESAGYRHDESS